MTSKINEDKEKFSKKKVKEQVSHLLSYQEENSFSSYATYLYTAYELMDTNPVRIIRSNQVLLEEHCQVLLPSQKNVLGVS